jgi:methyl halide transferase
MAFPASCGGGPGAPGEGREPKDVDASARGEPANASDWEQRYREGRTRWDLGGPPPVLVREIARRALPPRLQVFVPGAGFGHDALAWARAGHAVTAVDVAPSACRALAERAARTGLVLDVREADLFGLPADLCGGFDLVWEQTCLCALAPERRADYMRAVAGVLRPGGTFLGLFWNHGQPGGPPYDLDPTAVRALFAQPFEEQALAPVADSPPGRSHEFLGAWRRR